MISVLDRFLKQKTFVLKAEGNSMRPILFSGDVIHYRKVPFKNLKTNDIVLIQKNRRLFTHRIIYKNARRVITKGDHNTLSDGKIHPHNIIAKAIKIKRGANIFTPEDVYLLQSTIYFNEIVRVKNELVRKKIEFVFLKGLPLHLYVERSHPRRLYLDCDILVRQTDYAGVQKILTKLGYTEADASLLKKRSRRKNKPVEVTYNKITNGFMVSFDIHSKAVFTMTQLDRLEALYPQRFVDQLTDTILRTKHWTTIQNERFPILAPDYLIPYLALHFFHHGCRGAFRLEFLHKIIVSNLSGLNWAGLTILITTYQLQNFVYPVFLLLKKYYRTPVPRSFLKTIQPATPLTRRLANKLTETVIFNDESRIAAGISRFKNLFCLSPRPLWRRFFVFFNPQIISMTLWVLKNYLPFFQIRKKTV